MLLEIQLSTVEALDPCNRFNHPTFLCLDFFVVYEGNIKIFLKKSLKIPKGGNQNLYIKEEQTTQWPREKG
jgi:hypothetical protein